MRMEPETRTGRVFIWTVIPVAIMVGAFIWVTDEDADIRLIVSVVGMAIIMLILAVGRVVKWVNGR